MDGHFTDPKKGKQTIAFLSHWQAECYGGYLAATKILGVDYIQPVTMIDTFWGDISPDCEVGHA